MRFSTAFSSLSLLATLAAAQQNHSVDVGLNGLTYTPNTITAAVGDIITFTFHPKNHTLTQSTFTAPCTAAFDSTTGQAGFDTGFVPVATGQSSAPMSIRVTTATPLWFFCRQATHCQSGMVFAVNPTANKTFAEFQTAAMASQPQVPGQTAVPAASAPPAGAAPSATAPAPSAPAASAPAATVPGEAAPAPPAASSDAGSDPYGLPGDASTDGVTPTDGSDSGVSGVGSTAPTTTAKPNGAVSLSPRSAVFAAAFLVGAGMLL